MSFWDFLLFYYVSGYISDEFLMNFWDILGSRFWGWNLLKLMNS